MGIQPGEEPLGLMDIQPGEEPLGLMGIKPGEEPLGGSFNSTHFGARIKSCVFYYEVSIDLIY